SRSMSSGKRARRPKAYGCRSKGWHPTEGEAKPAPCNGTILARGLQRGKRLTSSAGNGGDASDDADNQTRAVASGDDASYDGAANAGGAHNGDGASGGDGRPSRQYRLPQS